MFLSKSLKLRREIESYRIQLYKQSKNQKLNDPVLVDMSEKLDQKTAELQKMIHIMMA
ncbi:Spo0E family sporulation regulatory protein-aspartic acid phosphatase [Bacillus salipaludis]|uniref:Spo0E family sporulation regulatory protein-aspartic acid phosphatase n=1 Tax=Bacillus salipaludis TaxID=2547811 RepID=A0A4R5VXF8_9BACI|nr:Spo0E family sporulation regulatory protein-aspartic acid phosphatase [Bacillus salipaludis]TDK64075.1 Spo0E family sporulation regulatory protein-aspartic acid phosphatase [Bacillus salipaludis]